MFAEVYRTAPQEFSLELHEVRDSDYPLQLYAQPTPVVCLEESAFIQEIHQEITTFFLPEALTKPMYFTLVNVQGSAQVCGFRIVPLEGMYNVRDLGGYPTKSGKHLRWGRLFRGDNLHNLKEEGLPYLKAMNFKSIVDFRKESECAHYPNGKALLDATEYHFVPDGEIAAFAGSLQNGEAMDSHRDQVELAKVMVQKDPEFAGKSMIAQQKEFVHKIGSQQAYHDTLALMAKETAAPLFFHCKGGKDRTGFAAMLLLGILGVDEELIYYDYLLTNRARKKKNQRYLENFRKMSHGDEAVAQYLYSIFDTRKEYLAAAMQEIKELSGSIRQYAIDVLHLTEAEILALETLYLE